MKVRESALRLKRFEAEEKTQKVSSLEQMVREFEQMAVDLERQIQAEEERTGVRDNTHFAYSTFARSAAQRRQNLLASITDLQDKLAVAVVERDGMTRMAADGALRRFDPLRDPLARRARPASRDDLSRSLGAAEDRIDFAREPAPEAPEISPARLEKLRALGYAR